MRVMLVGAVCVSFLFAASASASPMADPFGYFNVYSLGDIGSATSRYHSDFQGVAGAAGDVYFSWFSLEGNGSSTGTSLHTGGSATLTGAYKGDLEIGGDAHLGGVSVDGGIRAGGNIANFGGGSIGGDAIAGGDVRLSGSMTVVGDRISGRPLEPMVDHDAVTDFFLDTSADIADMASTGAVQDHWALLSFQGTSGVNVIDVDAETLRRAWGFSIHAPEDAVVYINVPDEEVELDWTGWSYSGGIDRGDVLLNMPNALSLELSSTNAVNILAPYADTQFDAGLLVGSLIVGDLQGCGQVNLGDFDHGGGAVPEPASMAMLAVGGLVVLRRRRR